MPDLQGYVECGGGTIIAGTDGMFSLHHSATVGCHFDEMFTPNVLEITLLSSGVGLHVRDWTFLKLSVVEREIDK